MRKKNKILLVEDTPLAQRVIGLALTSINCLYDIAKNGHEALKLTQENHYDLILMDIGLPDRNGLEIAQEIRKTSMDLPIIAVTAYSDEIYKQRALEFGLNDFVIKPITVEMCRGMVRRFISKKKGNSKRDPKLKKLEKII